MEAKFMLLIITAILMIIATRFKSNTFYLLSLFAWLAYLIKPIRDDVEDITISLNYFKDNKRKKWKQKHYGTYYSE